MPKNLNKDSHANFIDKIKDHWLQEEEKDAVGCPYKVENELQYH